MQRAIIGALVLTFCTSLLGSIVIWGTSVNLRAGTSDQARRRKEGLPPAPLWYESLWKRSPLVILSGIYISLSIAFVLYLLDFAGFFVLKLKGGLESPYELYEQCTPTEFWIGCGIWLVPLLVAVFIFLRSATRVLRGRKNLLHETSQSH